MEALDLILLLYYAGGRIPQFGVERKPIQRPASKASQRRLQQPGIRKYTGNWPK